MRKAIGIESCHALERDKGKKMKTHVKPGGGFTKMA